MVNFANLEEKLSFAHPEYHLDATKQKLGDFIRVKTHFLANCILLHFFSNLHQEPPAKKIQSFLIQAA